MQPYTDPVLELRLIAQKAEAKAAALPAGAAFGVMEDHRAEVIGELLDAFDRIDRGLGTRLLLAMYPKASALSERGERRAA